MSYDDLERSVSQSKPAELYTFVTPLATYRYTSHDTVVEYPSGSGINFTPVAISRPSVVAASANPSEFSITLPDDDAFCLAEAYSMPSYLITFTLTRVQLAGMFGIVIATGTVNGFGTEGRWTKVSVPSLFANAMDVPIPGVGYTPSCAHRLYDPRCGKLRTDLVLGGTTSLHAATTLTAYDGKRTYTAASVGGLRDQWFRAGELVLSSGERRLIVDQTGLQIELNAPLKTFVGGMSVDLYAGCDHTMNGPDGCVPKFANRDRFFGFHLMDPRRNPFDGSLRVFSR